jgi:hypothetical protein
LVASRGFAIGTVIQADLGGNASAGNCITGATATGHYTSTTVSGSTLMLVIFGKAAVTNADPINYTISTSGVTWVTNAGALPTSLYDPGHSETHGMDILWAINASSVNSSTNTSVTAKVNTVSCSSVTVEFVLLEVSGILAAAPQTNVAAGCENDQETPSAPGTTCDLSGAFSGKTGFVIGAFVGEGSTNLLAGTGYTLGPNATAAVVGQLQYAGGQSNIPVINFTGGTNPYWTCSLAWFYDGAASSSVPRHRGSVF